MDSFTIISVWYHKNEFVFNNSMYPFLHNIQYHATKYNYILLYLVEDETNIVIPKNDNISYINFKICFNKYVTQILEFKHKSNKIDFMKNIIIKECKKINYRYILFMDMDCEIMYFDKHKILYDNKFITLFYDITTDVLKSTELQTVDSYIENYAFLINKNKLYSNIYFENKYYLSEHESNSFIYEQFINFGIRYYKKELQFKFPNKCNKKTILPYQPIIINFERGGSWKIDIKNINVEKYIYNMNLKPIYDRNKHELYMYILVNNIDKIITIITNFINLGYNFKSYFNWSNSLQSKVNLYGVLIDRIDNIEKLNQILKLDFYKHVIKFEKTC